jgi:exopolysaccharide biosynthesis polyprenyl glycosylphosphotransferase
MFRATRRIDLAAVRRFHVYADVVLVSLGWLGAYLLRHGLNDVLGKDVNSFDSYLHALPLVVLPWIFCCWFFGIYRQARMQTLIDEFQLLLRGAFAGLLAVSTASFFFRELGFARSVVAMSGVLNLIFQGASRVVFHLIERRMQRSGTYDVRTLVLGTGVTAMRLLQKVQDHPEIGYRVVGFLDDDDDLVGQDVEGRPVLGRFEDLRKVALEQEIDEVFVAVPSLGHTRMLALVLECEDLGLTFRVVTNLFEVLTAGTPVDLVEDLPLVRLGREQVHPLYAPAKRLFDLVAATSLLIATAPLWLWCAIRIKLDAPGPVIFRQMRIGEKGRAFAMYKFRTMVHDASPYEEAPRDDGDARVTACGRWLRRTSLDELPQLWNVIRGNMSLVGPRPEMPFIVARYDEWQRRRLLVKPGITGLWQILGRKDLPMASNLQYDFYYIRNRSFVMDLSILIRTIGAVLTRKGAY